MSVCIATINIDPKKFLINIKSDYDGVPQKAYLFIANSEHDCIAYIDGHLIGNGVAQYDLDYQDVVNMIDATIDYYKREPTKSSMDPKNLMCRFVFILHPIVIIDGELKEQTLVLRIDWSLNEETFTGCFFGLRIGCLIDLMLEFQGDEYVKFERIKKDNLITITCFVPPYDEMEKMCIEQMNRYAPKYEKLVPSHC